MVRRPARVRFLPSEVDVEAWTGDTLLDAGLDHGVEIPHECGGNCTCTTCHVYIERGAANLSPIETPEDERLDSTQLRRENSRLACQALLRGESVEVMIVFDKSDITSG
jgi:2Fe-2S ferredoxin